MTDFRYTDELPNSSAFFALFETTGWNARYRASPEELSQALRGSWTTRSVYAENQLVGFGRVLCDTTMHALLLDLIVHPAYQRRGIGSTILGQLVDACRSAGIRDIQLFSAREKTAFYERNGFRIRPQDAPGMELRRISARSRDLPTQGGR